MWLQLLKERCSIFIWLPPLISILLLPQDCAFTYFTAEMWSHHQTEVISQSSGPNAWISVILVFCWFKFLHLTGRQEKLILWEPPLYSARSGLGDSSQPFCAPATEGPLVVVGANCAEDSLLCQTLEVSTQSCLYFNVNNFGTTAQRHKSRSDINVFHSVMNLNITFSVLS